MKKFKFRLEKILRLRENEREEKKRLFSIIQGEINEIEKGIKDREEERKRLELKEGTIHDFSNLLVSDQYRCRMEAEVITLRERLIEKNEELESRLLELKEAQKDVRALEHLKERKLQEYHQIVEREEAKQLDEFAVLRYQGGD